MKLYQTCFGFHISAYRDGIIQVMQNAVKEHPRTLVLRVDLHDPAILDDGDTISCLPNLQPGVMSRFISSLKAKLSAHQSRVAQAGKRVYPNTLRHAWVREYSLTGKRHFHILLFFNKDAYFHLGDYDLEGNTLRTMITTAWCSALNLTAEEGQHLVHYPKRDGKYTIRQQCVQSGRYDSGLIERIHYMTKVRSKLFDDKYRNFGCSSG